MFSVGQIVATDDEMFCPLQDNPSFSLCSCIFGSWRKQPAAGSNQATAYLESRVTIGDGCLKQKQKVQHRYEFLLVTVGVLRSYELLSLILCLLNPSSSNLLIAIRNEPSHGAFDIFHAGFFVLSVRNVVGVVVKKALERLG